MTLNGEHVVIIGGSSGIGLAIAKAVSLEGALVTIAGRTTERLEYARNQLSQEVTIAVVDATNETQISAFAKRLQRVDHVAVACGDIALDAITEINLEEARRTFTSKFWSAVLVARYIGPKISSGGSLLLFAGAGGLGWRPTPFWGIAGAANAAIGALGQTLALELAPVRVNVISPGLIVDPIANQTQDSQQAAWEEAAEQLPVRRVGSAEDVSQMAISLMKNGFTTGAIIPVDGGAMIS